MARALYALALASVRRRFGYRRLLLMIRSEGVLINHKKPKNVQRPIHLPLLFLHLLYFSFFCCGGVHVLLVQSQHFLPFFYPNRLRQRHIKNVNGT